METILSTRSYNKIFNQSDKSCCQILETDSPDQETNQTRGRLFVLIYAQDNNLEGNIDLPEIIRKTLLFFEEKYFGQKEGGILQQLQSSLESTKEQFYLSTHKPQQQWQTIDFSLSAAVVWGNILSYAHTREASISLIKNKEVINFPFSYFGSEKIDPGDIIVLGSPQAISKIGEKQLPQVFQPDKETQWDNLISQNLQDKEIKNCLGIFAFQIKHKEMPGKEEIIDIGIITTPEVKQEPEEKSAKKIDLSEIENLKTKSLNWIKQRISWENKFFIKKETSSSAHNKIFLTIGLALLLTISVVFTFHQRQKKKTEELYQQIQNQTEDLLSASEQNLTNNPQISGQYLQEAFELLQQLPEENEKKEDLKEKWQDLIDQTYRRSRINPNKTSGWSAEALSRQIEINANGVNNGQGEILIETETSWQEIIAADTFESAYGWNIYLLDKSAGQIHKYLALGNNIYSRRFDYFSETKNFNSAQDMTIDGAIYILYQDGSVNKFLTGDQEIFNLNGYYPSSSEKKTIFTGTENTHLYLSQGTEILSFDKESGEYQQSWTIENIPASIDHLYVNPEETQIWIKTGTDIFSFQI